MPAVGDIAPTTEMATDTSRFSLATHDGKKMVIFFFPRADTSGCTKESIQFSDLTADFAFAGAEVVGISKDAPKKQAKFCAKYFLKCHLGADYVTDICKQFGVWVEKSMYDKTYMGVQRATLLLTLMAKLPQSGQKRGSMDMPLKCWNLLKPFNQCHFNQHCHSQLLGR